MNLVQKTKDSPAPYVVMVALLLLLAGACGSAGSPSSAPTSAPTSPPTSAPSTGGDVTSAYLSALNKLNVSAEADIGGPARAVKYGQAVCTDFDNGNSLQTELNQMGLSSTVQPLSPNDGTAIAVAAVQTLCPRHLASIEAQAGVGG